MLSRLSVIFIFVSSAFAATVHTGAFPQGLYLDCQGGGLSKVCENTIQEAWNAGNLRTFTTEHQFFTGSDGNCKVTCWTDSNYTVQLESIDQIEAAVQKVDDFCLDSGLSIASPSEETQGFRNVYVGRLDKEYVVFMLDGNPQ